MPTLSFHRRLRPLSLLALAALVICLNSTVVRGEGAAVLTDLRSRALDDLFVLQEYRAGKNSFVESPERHTGEWTEKGFRYTPEDTTVADGAHVDSVEWDVFGPVPIPHDPAGQATAKSALPCSALGLVDRRQFDLAEVNLAAFGLNTDRPGKHIAIDRFVDFGAVHRNGQIRAVQDNVEPIPFAHRFFVAADFLDPLDMPRKRTAFDVDFPGGIAVHGHAMETVEVAGAAALELGFDAARERFGFTVDAHQDAVVARFLAGRPAPLDNEFEALELVFRVHVSHRFALADEQTVADTPDVPSGNAMLGKVGVPTSQVLPVEQLHRFTRQSGGCETTAD